MKAVVIALAALAAIAAGYFGARKLSGMDLGFGPAKLFAGSLVDQLLHTEQTTTREVGLREAV
jgi:hypothetical protein